MRRHIVVLLAYIAAATATLEVVNQWSLMQFDFPPDPVLLEKFQPENTVPTGLEIGWDRLYLGIPRLRAGVPATLAWIPRSLPPGVSPVLQVRSVYFPRELLRPASLLTNLVLDDTRSSNSRLSSSCDHLFAYISDTVAPGLIVYDGRRDNAWRVTHASMYPDPDLGEYDIGGERFTLMDGIVGLAHSPAQGLLYYQPLATDRLFSVSTAVLASGPPAEGTDLPVNLVGRKSSQGLGVAVDPRDDTIIFSPMTETAIAAWNPITNSHKVLAQDAEKLQFCAEVRWAERDNGAVWALSTRFHKFFRRSASKHETNIRILRVLDSGFVSLQPHVLRRAARAPRFNATLHALH